KVDNKIKTELSKTDEGYGNIIAELNKCLDDDKKLEYISSFSPNIQEILLNSINTGHIKSLSNSQIFTYTTDNELEMALKYPLDKWRIFLHPVQKTIALHNPNINVLVSGFAGTGKTVVLIHRLKYIISLNSFDQIIVLLPTEELKLLVSEMLNKIIDDIPSNVIIMVPSAKKDFKYFIKNIQLSFKCHILIDEFQLFGLHYFRHFDILLQNKNIYWTILFDPAQKYYPIQFDKFLNDNFIPIYLYYAYRNTKQILDYSNKYKDKYLQIKTEIPSSFYPPEPITTINGLPIKLLSTSFDKLDETINKEVDFLLSKYEDDEIVLINNYPYESVLRPRGIKFNLEKWKIKTVAYSKTSGLEYKAGIILGGDRIKVDNRKDLANAYTYISITRFRDYVILINIFSNSI
ncbi:MAG: AAA family ATPase, partial [Ignavibacteriaceae bacterium]|nr:AAA family ATPase [Ignavibacteriaceae bacterium]